MVVLSIVVGGYISDTNQNRTNQITKNINIVEENTIKEAIDKVYNAVVLITSYRLDDGDSVGSGFIYKTDDKYGYILTNNHVIAKSNTISVMTNDLKEIDATLLGYDEPMDLAILRIAKEDVSLVAPIGNSSDMKIGDTVFTVGSPEGIQYMGTVTKGIISGLNREVKIGTLGEDYTMSVIQTDAAINPGNSGGPLVNINGEVIGINSLKLVQDEIEGMGFAIPIEEVLLYTDSLEKGETIKRPYLGLELMDNDIGIVINAINNNAISRDLQKGDIIIKLDDTSIRDTSHFRYLLYKHKIGDKVKITYIRGLKEAETYIELET